MREMRNSSAFASCSVASLFANEQSVDRGKLVFIADHFKTHFCNVINFWICKTLCSQKYTNCNECLFSRYITVLVLSYHEFEFVSLGQKFDEERI